MPEYSHLDKLEFVSTPLAGILNRQLFVMSEDS